MIVYHSDKTGFMQDVETGDIEGIILDRFRRARGWGVGDSEVRSWRESLTQMHLVLVDQGIPADSGVSVELQIPQTAKRIDFIVSGQDEARTDRAVIVELKQWEAANRTPMDGLVETFVGGGNRQVSHPSYQAWSYAQLLRARRSGGPFSRRYGRRVQRMMRLDRSGAVGGASGSRISSSMISWRRPSTLWPPASRRAALSW